MSSRLLPPPLRPGERVGFCSPSSPVTATAPRRTRRAMRFLEGRGYELVPGALTGHSDHYRSGSIEQRAEEFNALARDPSIRVIMSTIGGSNSNALLPYLDMDALVADPKIIIGYSDMTSILLGIYAKTGLVTFYGPALVASFGEFPPVVDETFARFEAVVSGHQGAPLELSIPSTWTEEMIPWESQDRAKTCQPNTCRFLGSGTVRGRLIGGNLNTMWSTWGSPWMPEIEAGDVLLIEDSLKTIATVERLFAFLSLNGVFERIGAVLLGKHELFDDGGTGRRPIDVLREVLGGRSVPIVDGFDSCHTHPMITVPLGLHVEVDFDRGAVTLLEPWLDMA